MMHFLMPQQAMSTALEFIINQAIAKSTQSLTLLAQMEQQTLAINLTELPFPLVFTSSQENILVSGDLELANCVITTSLKTLQQLKSDNALTEAIKLNKLDLEGDLKVAQRFASLMDSISIDWQSELAKHIGDIATYKVSRLASSLWQKLAFTGQQVQADASEWLVHEKKLSITQDEYLPYRAGVTDVSNQIDGLAQRILQLEQKFNKP